MNHDHYRAFNRAKQWMIYSFITLLVACGSQEGINTDVASVKIASFAPNNIATQATDTTTLGTSPKRDLLANLALTYPGGVLPAERAAEAAAQLGQNPAALKYNAAANNLVTAQTASFTSQAAGSYTVGLSSPVQRAQNTSLFGSYFFSIYPSEMTNALATNPTWNLEGTAFHASLGINPGLAHVYRFRNLINGSYLYTINEGEKNDINVNYRAFFTLEGPAWYASPVPALGYSPLYRFRNLTNGTYLFSAYEAEKEVILSKYSALFLYEGISYYVRLASGLELSLLAGSEVSGSVDGVGILAKFNKLGSMTKDALGNVYVTDYHAIRKITPSGVVTTFAGNALFSGTTNGSVSIARFNFPRGLVLRKDDSVMYVADSGNCQIRFINMATSQVGTLAGNPVNCVETDNANYSLAKFNSAIGALALNRAETKLFILNSTDVNGTLRTLSFAQGTTTLASNLVSPLSLALDSADNAYVLETAYSSITKITPVGLKSSLAGLRGLNTQGFEDGLGGEARFNMPQGIVFDDVGNFYVTDNIGLIRKVTLDGAVTTVAGSLSERLLIEGFLPASMGSGVPSGITIAKGKLYVGTNNSRILQINGLP